MARDALYEALAELDVIVAKVRSDKEAGRDGAYYRLASELFALVARHGVEDDPFFNPREGRDAV